MRKSLIVREETTANLKLNCLVACIEL